MNTVLLPQSSRGAANGRGLESAEALLTNPSAYDSFKRKQLARRPPIASDCPIELQTGDWCAPDPLRSRRTHRRFNPAVLERDVFARALSSFRQDRTVSSGGALYPSAAGLYPIDIYVHVKSSRVGEIPGASYFYNPVEGSLHAVAPESAIAKDLHHHQNRSVHAGSAFTIFFVFDSDVTSPLYREAAEGLARVETGMMAATFNVVAETLGIGVCPIGLIDTEMVVQALRLRSYDQITHVMECGLAVPEETESSEINVADLRRFLAAGLPDYMVPSEFALIDEVPLTPNNKVDREALLRCDAARSLDLGTQFTAPSNDLEARLAALWKKVVRAEKVGIDDNFFDLGGDSIGVAEVNRCLSEEWKVEVPMVKLFQHPTIRSLAGYLAEQLKSAPTPAAPPLSEMDQKALAWLRANPQDPRASAVAAKLKARGVSL